MIRRFIFKRLLSHRERMTLLTWYRALELSGYPPLDVDHDMRRMLSLGNAMDAR